MLQLQEVFFVKSRKCGQAFKNSLSPSVPGLKPPNRPKYSNPCALTKSQALNPISNPKAPNRHSCGALINMCPIPIRVVSWHFGTCNARGRKKAKDASHYKVFSTTTLNPKPQIIISKGVPPGFLCLQGRLLDSWICLQEMQGGCASGFVVQGPKPETKGSKGRV